MMLRKQGALASCENLRRGIDPAANFLDSPNIKFDITDNWSLKLTFSLIAFVFATLILGCESPPAPNNLETTQVENVYLRRIGIGDDRPSLLNSLLLNPEKGVDATVLQTTHDGIFVRTLDRKAEGLVVRFQPSSGHTEYLTLKGSGGAWAGVVNNDDIFIGGHMSGFLYHLNRGGSQLQPIRIPRPNDESFEFIWSIDIGSDEKLYAGTYPECALLSYNPQNGEIENLGVIVEGEQYLRHVNARFPDRIYCGIGAHAQLVEYDLKTGEKQVFLPEKYQDRSFVYYSDRFLNMLAAVVTPDPVLLFFDPESKKLLREVFPPDGENGFWIHDYHAFIEYERDLFIATTPSDNLYRYSYDHNQMQLVAEGLGRPFGLAQDRYLFCRNYFGVFSIYDLRTEKLILRKEGNFTGRGMQIYNLANGPDDSIIGGAYINQGLFIYDPDNDHIDSYGTSVSFGGQIDNLVSYKGRNYLAHYTGARLSVHDPKIPWKPGNQPDSNPKVIGEVGQKQDRFSSVYVEGSRFYFGTQPKYGALGGSIAIFDAETESFEVHRNVVKDQSVYALTGNGRGLVFGSTSIRGGYGAKLSATEAKLFTWSISENRKIHERTIVPGAYEMWDLCWLPEGRLIGSSDSTIYLYDPDQDRIINTLTTGSETIISLELSSDGWCYGNTENKLFRVSRDLKQIQEIDSRPGYWRGLTETKAGRLYVGIGAVLYEIVREGHSLIGLRPSL